VLGLVERDLKRSLPKEILIDLLGLDQILELLQSCIAPELEVVLGKVNLLEELQKLLSALGHVPVTPKFRKMLGKLIEIHPITAIVRASRAK
jgi:hypothetical protein